MDSYNTYEKQFFVVRDLNGPTIYTFEEMGLIYADAVITDGKSLIGIIYDRNVCEVPFVSGMLDAEEYYRMLSVLKEQEVYVVELIPLARVLQDNYEVGDMVTPELFAPISKILAKAMYEKVKE